MYGQLGSIYSKHLYLLSGQNYITFARSLLKVKCKVKDLSVWMYKCKFQVCFSPKLRQAGKEISEFYPERQLRAWTQQLKILVYKGFWPSITTVRSSNGIATNNNSKDPEKNAITCKVISYPCTPWGNQHVTENGSKSGRSIESAPWCLTLRAK